jgi:hypothetical protein
MAEGIASGANTKKMRAAHKKEPPARSMPAGGEVNERDHLP